MSIELGHAQARAFVVTWRQKDNLRAMETDASSKLAPTLLT
jgi:hypothetical protein